MENAAQKGARTVLIYLLKFIGDMLMQFPFLHPETAKTAQDSMHRLARTLRENPWARPPQVVHP